MVYGSFWQFCVIPECSPSLCAQACHSPQPSVSRQPPKPLHPSPSSSLAEPSHQLIYHSQVEGHSLLQRSLKFFSQEPGFSFCGNESLHQRGTPWVWGSLYLLLCLRSHSPCAPPLTQTHLGCFCPMLLPLQMVWSFELTTGCFLLMEQGFFSSSLSHASLHFPDFTFCLQNSVLG